MRAFLARVIFAAATMVLALTAQGVASPPAKQAPAQGPLEMKIFGPGFIYTGQKIKYRVVLTNRSSEDIVLASQDARLDFNVNWSISDLWGRELPQMAMLICPVGGKGWFKNLVRHMKDSDVTTLKPGEKFEFVFDNVSDNYIFPGSGKYQLAFSYSYIPPQFEGHDGSPVDNFDAKYDVSDLSAATLENLRRSVPIFAGAKAMLIVR
jgi:hypothetical protein